jgi:hypothetical protein
LILTPFVLAGCGSRFATVEGKVTVDGHPANSGRVFFRSADGKSVVFAYIMPEGTYQAMDVPLGPMKVTVTPLTRLERDKLQRSAKKKPNAPESPAVPKGSFVPIPPKYEDPDGSGLTTTVNSGINTYDIELSSR